MTDGELGQLEGQPATAVGKVLDGWRLEQLLGIGGMGAVFRARHETSGVLAALKVVRAVSGSSTDALKRFRREVQALARLEHPAIVRILQESLDHTPPYFCMEFLPGGSLAARIDQGRAAALPGRPILEPEWLAGLAQELAEGLAVVHAGHILHRDIKPPNILFTLDGRAKLSDFGLAKLQDATALTVANQVMGSVPYLAPESLRAQGFTERSDLYQLGATLFDAATGSPPYAVEQLLGVAYNLALPPLPGLAGLAPVLSQRLPWFEPMLQRLMANAPEDRYSSAAELAADIAARRQRGTAVGRPSKIEERVPRPSRHPRPDQESGGNLRRVALLAGAVLVLWGVCIAGFALRWGPQDAPARDPANEEAAVAKPPPPSPAGPELPVGPPRVTVGATSAHLWFDRPPPPRTRIELREEGSSSGRTRELTGPTPDLLFEGLVSDAVYRGALFAGTDETAAFAFRTLKKAHVPGGAVLTQQPEDASEPKLEAAGDHVVALWRRSAPSSPATRLDTVRSPDGGLTWTQPEELASSPEYLYSATLSVGTSDAVAAWHEGTPDAPGGRVCVRRWSRETGGWGPVMKTEVGANLDGLGVMRCAGRVDLLGVIEVSGSPTGRALARIPLPATPAGLPRFESLVTVPASASGALRVAVRHDTAVVAVDNRRGNNTWDLAWTSADFGKSPSWQPTRAFAAPDDDVGKFDLAPLGDGFVVLYEAGGQIFTRLLRPPALSPRQRLPANDFLQTSGVLASARNRIYLAYLASDPANLFVGAIRLYRSSDGLHWERLPSLDVRKNILLRLRLAISGRRLLALTTGDVDRLAVAPLPLRDGL